MAQLGPHVEVARTRGYAPGVRLGFDGCPQSLRVGGQRLCGLTEQRDRGGREGQLSLTTAGGLSAGSQGEPPRHISCVGTVGNAG